MVSWLVAALNSITVGLLTTPVPLTMAPTAGVPETLSTGITVPVTPPIKFTLAVEKELLIESTDTVSKTLTAKESDSLYKISIDDINNRGLMLLTVFGNGILSSILVTLFSINSTIVLLKASCSSSTFIGGAVSTLYIK